MSISRFYTITFTVKRMVWSGETAKLDDTTSFKGHIQQATMELVQSLGLTLTKPFSLWCDTSVNLQIGDQIASGGNFYSVKAVNTRDYSGVNKHIEAVIEQTQSFE